MFDKLVQKVASTAKAVGSFLKRNVAAVAVGAGTLLGSLNAKAAAAVPAEISDLTGSADLVWDSVTPIIAGVTLFLIAIKFVRKIR